MKRSLHPFHTLKEVFDLLPDAVLVVDENGKIMLYNQEFSALLGYSPDEMVSQPVEAIIPQRYRDRHAGKVAGFFQKKESRKMAAGLRLYALKKNGKEVQVDIALSPYELFGTWYTIAVIRELTDKLYLEQKIGSLEKIKEELEHFACVVSHDLKAPVKRVHILVDLIMKELPEAPSENLQVLVKHLNQSIALTEKLIEGILQQARTEYERHTELVSLNDILEEAKKGMMIPPGFLVKVDHKLPVIKGNPTQWIQIFINLITNAIKYNDKPEGVVKIDWIAQDGFIHLVFSDNGTIVPPEKRDSIFQLFYRARTEPDGSSHGVGLSIVKKIVEKGGGRIEYAESKMGGSEFRIYWPV